MNLEGSTLYVAIAACEIAFWLVLVAGLVFRYLIPRPRVSQFFLVSVPLIDVALLVFTVLDLHSGAIATFAHGLAIAYVGFTIAFGPTLISWTDQRFAYKFNDGPPPIKPPTHGWASVLYELRLWARCLLAASITYLLLIAVIAFIDQASRTQALEAWFQSLLGILFFWFIFGPLWQLVFFKRESESKGGDS